MAQAKYSKVVLYGADGQVKPVPPDEPLFVLRGQDRLAWQTVLYYADLLAGLAPEPDEPEDKYYAQAEAVRAHAEAMRKYPAKKFPD